MRLNPLVMPLVVIGALFGTVWTAQAMGQWSTSGRVALTPGKMTAADLKGWMTLQEVIDGLGISQADVYAAGKIPADVPPTTPLNKLEALVPGFSVTGLREALAPKPATGSAPAAATAPAASVTAAPTLASVAAATPTVAKESGTGAGPTPLPAGEILPWDQIKGKMTLKDVSVQCAVPLDKLLEKLNLPANTLTNTSIKDLIAQSKLTEVTDVQQVVKELQGK